MHTCDCPLPCGLDHCCSVESLFSWSTRDDFDAPIPPCPKQHPPEQLRLALEGDRMAARELAEIFARHGLTTWSDVMISELNIIARRGRRGALAVKSNREEIAASWLDDPGRRRYRVSIDVELQRGNYLSGHKEFDDPQTAQAWAESMTESAEAFRVWLTELDESLSPLSGPKYRSYRDAYVRIVAIEEETLALPWQWINKSEVWHHVSMLWRWEHPRYKELVAERQQQRKERSAD